MAIEKIKILGGRFGATSYTALPIQPILPDFLVNGSKNNLVHLFEDIRNTSVLSEQKLHENCKKNLVKTQVHGN